MSYKRDHLGKLSTLVDDALTHILHVLDVPTLLRLEQTCKYMYTLIQDRKLWLDLLLALPPHASPNVTPIFPKDDAEYRHLVISAMRGYTNWSSPQPKPTSQIPFHPPESWLDGPNKRVHFVPGGQFFFIFESNGIQCYNIHDDKVVLDYSTTAHIVGFDMEPMRDGEHVRISTTEVYSRSNEIAFKVYQVNLWKCTRETLYRLKVPWEQLHTATNAGLHSLQNSQIDGNIIFVKFVTERPSRVRLNGQQKRAGFLINWEKNSVSVVYIVEPEHPEDIFCPSFVAAKNLVYLTGRSSRKPTIHAVPLSQLSAEAEKNGTHVRSWPKFTIEPKMAVTHTICERFTTSGIAMQVSLRQPTWLDRERAQRRDPSVAYLAIIDVAIYWTQSSFREFTEPYSILLRTIPESAARYFKLALCVHRSHPKNEDGDDENDKEKGKEKRKKNTWVRRFSQLNEPVTVDKAAGELRSVPPSIHGRMLHPRHTINFIQEDEDSFAKISAISLVDKEVKIRPLEHLNGKKIIFSCMDYYTGAIILAYQSKLPNSGKFETSHVLELYN